MRLTGGRLRGKALYVPEGRAIRPTSDRARESVFNILQHGRVAAAHGATLAGAFVLDAFAGTGAFGLEALSRGAAHAAFMDNAPAAQRALRRNIASCDAGRTAEILPFDAVLPPRADRPADIAFLDPPYGSELLVPALAALHRQGWLGAASLVVVEMEARENPALPAPFVEQDARRYGAARIAFLSCVALPQ